MVFMDNNTSHNSPSSSHCQRPSSVPVSNLYTGSGGSSALDDFSPGGVKLEYMAMDKERPTSTHSLQAQFYMPSGSQNSSPYQQHVFHSTNPSPAFKTSYSPPLVYEDAIGSSQQYTPSLMDDSCSQQPPATFLRHDHIDRRDDEDSRSGDDDPRANVSADHPENTSDEILSETSGDSDQLMKTEEKISDLQPSETCGGVDESKKDWMETMRLYAERLRPVDCVIIMEECRPFNAHTEYMNYFKENLLKPILHHLNGGPEINVEFGCDVYTSLYSFLTIRSSSGATTQHGASTTPMIYRILKEFDDLNHEPRFSLDFRLKGSTLLQEALVKFTELDNYRGSAHCQSVRYLLLLSVSDIDLTGVEAVASQLRSKAVGISVFSPRESETFRQLYDAVNTSPCNWAGSSSLWPTALLSTGMQINGGAPLISATVTVSSGSAVSTAPAAATISGPGDQGANTGSGGNASGSQNEVQSGGVRSGVSVSSVETGQGGNLLHSVSSATPAAISQPPSISSTSHLDQPPSSNMSDNVCTPQSFIVASPLPQPNTPQHSEPSTVVGTGIGVSTGMISHPPALPQMTQMGGQQPMQMDPSIRQPVGMVRTASMLQQPNQMPPGMIQQTVRSYQPMSRSPATQQSVMGGPVSSQPGMMPHQQSADYQQVGPGMIVQQRPQGVNPPGRLLVPGPGPVPGMIRQRSIQPPQQYSSSPGPPVMGGAGVGMVPPDQQQQQAQVQQQQQQQQQPVFIAIFDGFIKYTKEKEPSRGCLYVDNGPDLRVPNLQHWNRQAIIQILRVERNGSLVESHLMNQNQLTRVRIEFADIHDYQSVQAIMTAKQGPPNILPLGIMMSSTNPMGAAPLPNAIRCVCLVSGPKNGQLIGIIPCDQDKFIQDIQHIVSSQHRHKQQAGFAVGPPQNTHAMMGSGNTSGFYQQQPAPQQHIHPSMSMPSQQMYVTNPVGSAAISRGYLHADQGGGGPSNRVHPGNVYPGNSAAAAAAQMQHQQQQQRAAMMRGAARQDSMGGYTTAYAQQQPQVSVAMEMPHEYSTGFDPSNSMPYS